MRSYSYKKFSQGIHSRARKYGFPLRVMFELTYRCNFYCKHCYLPDSYKSRKGELKTEEVFSILKQLAEIGCFYLGFTGGEPFMRQDIKEILRYAKKCGFEIIIYTNGSLIDQKMAEELSCLSPNKVDITLPAMSKQAFDKISGVPGAHQRVFKAIEYLHKRKVNLGFKTCVLKENENEIPEIQEFAASLGAKHRLDNKLLPRLDGSPEPYKFRGKLLNNQTRAECGLIEKSPRRTLASVDLFSCGVGVSQAAINPFGELKMCLMIDYPKYKISAVSMDARSGSLKEVWERMKALVSRIKPDVNYKCHECDLGSYCKWCPAASWLHSRNFTSCDPQNKSWARHRKSMLEHS